MSRRTVAVLFFTGVCAAAAVAIAPSKGMAARTQIEILSARVDLTTNPNRITIVGDIVSDVTPAVSLAGVGLIVESYDPATGTVVADLPGGLSAGTYRLRVSEGHVTDSMGVTITP